MMRSKLILPSVWCVRLLVLLAVGVWLGGTAESLADIKLIPGKKKDKQVEKDDDKRMEQVQTLAPEVKPTQVSFVAGRSVEIQLDAATAVLSGLKFLIREQPSHGVLSDLRPHPSERHKALVTYTHTGGDALNDSFTYACRINEGPFSAPARVTLLGRRPQPRLQVLQQAQFGRVLPGAEVMAKVVVSNTGIGSFARDLEWPSPWKGPPRLELGIGEQIELAVLIKPERPGVVSNELVLQEGNPASRVRLWLQCEQPFIVTPSRAAMTYDKERGLRWVKAKVANATKEPMTLRFMLPERLEGPSEVMVPPNDLREVEFVLGKDDVALFKGDVTVTDGALVERLSLGASPKPPLIELLAPSSGVLQFGSHEQGKVGKAKVILINRGGEAAVLAIQAPPPFRVPEEEQSLSVAPGATCELAVEVMSSKAGKYAGKVVVSGDGNRIELGAEASYVDPKVLTMSSVGAGGNEGANAAPTGLKARPKVAALPQVEPVAAGVSPDAPPMAETKNAQTQVGPLEDDKSKAVTLMGRVDARSAALLSHLSVFGAPLPEELISNKYEKLQEIQVINQGRDFLELAWDAPHPDSPPESYRVEQGYQVYVPATKMFFRDWAPISGVEPLRMKDGREGVRVSGLRPAAQYEFRFMAVDDRGKYSVPSDIYLLRTLPPWKMPSWVGVTLGLVALGSLLLLARRLYLKRMGLILA